MDISALVNPAPEAPRRSPSNARSITAPSPALSVSKLPTPPLSIHKPMSNKRKRYDPKPIWAVREGEKYVGPPVEARRLRQPSQPAPSTPQPQSQALPPRVQPHSAASTAHPAPFTSRELTGFERPVTDDGVVYDEISRKACDFIWANVAENPTLRHAVDTTPDCQVEIEARWGQIILRDASTRLQGVHETECVVRKHVAETTKFESTMSLEQHKKMNAFLNAHVARSKNPEMMRTEINYMHTKEIDMFYNLDQAGFNRLSDPIKTIIHEGKVPQRIRVTYKQGPDGQPIGEPIRKIIKLRIDNLEISSPQTEWDYRIGINLEINYPHTIDGLKLVVEKGRTPESMQRKKDRMSYSWLSAFQIDLTQVRQGAALNHELELELDSDKILTEIENIKTNRPTEFEEIIRGMMNNLRVLSREITPQ